VQEKVVRWARTSAWPGTATPTRVGVIDERGHRHEADLILVLLARDLLQRHPGARSCST